MGLNGLDGFQSCLMVTRDFYGGVDPNRAYNYCFHGFNRGF